MDTPSILLLSAFALVAVVALWRAIQSPRRRELPYTKRPSLLTAAEMRFYRVLLAVLPTGMAICVKVRLMDVVLVPDGMWQQYGAQGSGMHLDFVLADVAMLEPRLVIELDDRSHWQSEAQRRDAFKNAALASAGVPMLRIREAPGYDVRELRERIREAMMLGS